MENYFDFGAANDREDSFMHRKIDVSESIDQFELMREKNAIHSAFERLNRPRKY